MPSPTIRFKCPLAVLREPAPWRPGHAIATKVARIMTGRARLGRLDGGAGLLWEVKGE